MIDPERLSALFAAHAAQALLYARQWLDRTAADDIVQEVFVRLMLQDAVPTNVRAWLFKAVRNEAISQARSSARRRRREQELTRQQWFAPASLESADAAMAAEVLQSLPPAQREVIVLRIWGQMTLKEVAAITGTAISSVFDQYRAGIGGLRERMGESCHNRNK